MKEERSTTFKIFVKVKTSSILKVIDHGVHKGTISRVNVQARRAKERPKMVYAVVMPHPDTFVKAEGRIMLMI